MQYGVPSHRLPFSSSQRDALGYASYAYEMQYFSMGLLE